MSLEDKIVLAWKIAEEYHRGQVYGSKGLSKKTDIPYLYHLGQVFIEASLSALKEDDVNREVLLLSAILHDILEDTDFLESRLMENFGYEVTESIKSLTKNELIKKGNQMDDSLNRILTQSRETAMVKLCDRISNISRKPPVHWKPEWIASYADEADKINSKLGFSSAYLSQRLKEKTDLYRKLYI